MLFLQLRLTQVLPKSPDCLSSTTRFRYVDVKSPSFKTKLSRYKEPSQEDNPKVLINKDEEENGVSPMRRQVFHCNSQDSSEHLIEIVIPDSVPEERPKARGDALPNPRSLTGISVLDQISSLTENQTMPAPNQKPKIVSYLPKRHRKLSSEVGHRRTSNGELLICPSNGIFYWYLIQIIIIIVIIINIKKLCVSHQLRSVVRPQLYDIML